MANTYVFFVGGTGARVFRSLMMLLASGARLGTDEIRPILIDYDVDNGDKLRSEDLVNQYQQLHNKAQSYDSQNVAGGFFFQKIAGYKCINLNYKETFAEKIDYKSIASNRSYDCYAKLIEVLYNNYDANNCKQKLDNDPTELNLLLNKGFKGNPNIGTVVFPEAFESDEFSGILKEFNEGDRFFIVGSIFGGTGASCLPKLVHEFRENKDYNKFKSAVGGACIVMPYYKLKDDKASSINSDTFNSKTKAALDYYAEEINKELQGIYYIGKKDVSTLYDNHEGGKEQKNDANLVELLAAMSILEFSKTSFGNVGGEIQTKFYEYSVTDSGSIENESLKSPSTLEIFGKDIKSKDSILGKYVKYLCAFAYFCEDYRYYLFRTSKKWFKEQYSSPVLQKINGDSIIGPESSEFGKQFVPFIAGNDDNGGFIGWANELKNNSACKFAPFEFGPGNIKDLLNVSGTNKKKVDEDYLEARICDSYDIVVKSENNKNGTTEAMVTNYLRAAYDGCMQAVYLAYGEEKAYESILK